VNEQNVGSKGILFTKIIMPYYNRENFIGTIRTVMPYGTGYSKWMFKTDEQEYQVNDFFLKKKLLLIKVKKKKNEVIHSKVGVAPIEKKMMKSCLR
jgi:hypothetical protein